MSKLGEENTLASSVRHGFERVGVLTQFSARFFSVGLTRPFEFREIANQGYLIGYKSLPLVVVTAMIIGFVLTIQSRPTLASFGAESWLPAMVSLSIIREIGPVITALICAGKIGSGMGAEISSMKVTEQIDAMEVSGINPFKYIVVTRVLAATLTIPLLVIVGDAVSIAGVFGAVNIGGHVTIPLFLSEVFANLTFRDLLTSFGKTFFFGFAIGIIGCYEGYYAEEGTRGVGKAANTAVVISSLLIFLIDAIVVQITTGMGK